MIVFLMAGRSSASIVKSAILDFFGDTDDSAFAWALGLGYEINRHLAIRGMFERSTGHDTINRCPPGLACPAIEIREDTDFNSASLVALPRLPVSEKTSLYATLGLSSTGTPTAARCYPTTMASSSCSAAAWITR